jgi:hypothetical protein
MCDIGETLLSARLEITAPSLNLRALQTGYLRSKRLEQLVTKVLGFVGTVAVV